MLGLMGVGVGAIACVALIEVVHIADKYQVTHVSGTWMALAKYVNEGTLYPPLYNGHDWGGTRYMPLQILINAAAADLTGEYLVSAKLVAYVLLTLLLLIIFAILKRHFDLPSAVAVAAVAALLVANVGAYSATSIGADTLAATLQVLAVALVYRTTTRLATVSAALLCVLAFLTKVTAVWAVVAIVVWLAARDRRRLGLFAVSLLLPLAISLGLLGLATDGRLFTNVFGLGGGTLLPFREAVVTAPRKFLQFLNASGPAISMIFPFALLGLGVAVRRRRVGLYHFSFAASFLILLFVLTDRGTAYNQFIDVEVLSVLVIADFVRHSAGREDKLSVIGAVFAVTITWAIVMSFAVDVGGPLKDTLRAVTARKHAEYPIHPVSAFVSSTDRLLSQDPYIPVSMGELPVVLDAYMFRRVTLAHPAWRDHLIERLDAQEFDKVVMFRHVGPHGELDPSDPYWRTNHFGPAVVAAIVRNYRTLGEANAYWIYVPRH